MILNLKIRLNEYQVQAIKSYLIELDACAGTKPTKADIENELTEYTYQYFQGGCPAIDSHLEAIRNSF